MFLSIKISIELISNDRINILHTCNVYSLFYNLSSRFSSYDFSIIFYPPSASNCRRSTKFSSGKSCEPRRSIANDAHCSHCAVIVMTRRQEKYERKYWRVLTAIVGIFRVTSGPCVFSRAIKRMSTTETAHWFPRCPRARIWHRSGPLIQPFRSSGALPKWTSFVIAIR